MGFFEPWELKLWVTLNLLIAVAYFVIPARIFVNMNDEVKRSLSERNSWILLHFIFWCGVGHIVMAWSMVDLARSMENRLGELLCAEIRENRSWREAVNVIMLVSSSMIVCWRSWEAAIRLRLMGE